MIKEGDRILVALSGGKDSLSLVHILKYFQSVSPVKF
jgi:tRNA 2-thiocytidine biosynthesis protein TtcA